MQRSVSFEFREILKEYGCHSELRRHLEAEQRRWMEFEMEFFFMRRFSGFINVPKSSIFAGCRGIINPYFMERGFSLGGVADRFLKVHLPEEVYALLERDEQLLESRHEYLNRLVKSVALKFRDEIELMENKVGRLRQNDEALFRARLAQLREQLRDDSGIYIASSMQCKTLQGASDGNIIR